MAFLQQFLFYIQYLVILDVDFDRCNDLVRLVTVCCYKFGQSPCMTCIGVRNTSNTQCNMTCFQMLLDVQALKILQCIPHKVKEKLGMHNFVAQPEALILMCLLVPPSCTCVKAQDTPSVVTKVLMVCCKIQSSKCWWNWRIGWQMWRSSSHSRRLKDNPLSR